MTDLPMVTLSEEHVCICCGYPIAKGEIAQAIRLRPTASTRRNPFHYLHPHPTAQCGDRQRYHHHNHNANGVTSKYQRTLSEPDTYEPRSAAELEAQFPPLY